MAVSRSRGRIDRDAGAPPPKSDAYVGLLSISLVALIIGSVFLFLDYSQYDNKKPTLPPAPILRAPTTPAAPGG
jgi:hypothetical protein